MNYSVVQKCERCEIWWEKCKNVSDLDGCKFLQCFDTCDKLSYFYKNRQRRFFKMSQMQKYTSDFKTFLTIAILIPRACLKQQIRLTTNSTKVDTFHILSTIKIYIFFTTSITF